MDISDVKPGSRTLEILHPKTKEEIGLKFMIISLDDERIKKTRRAITDQRLHLEQRNKSFKAEDIEDNALRLQFEAMDGWEWYNDLTFHGSVPDFTKKNVYAVLRELDWVQTQLNTAFNETETFFDGSKAI